MKQSNQNKNPKRVEAARKAAANRVRIGGQFVTKSFQKELQRHADRTGHAGDLQTFFDQNEIQYSKLYKTGVLRSVQEKADSTVFDEMKGRNVLLNGNESSEPEVSYRMLELEQWLFSNTNTAGIAWKPKIYFNGKYEIDLPTISELEQLFEEMDETEAVQYIYDNYKIKVWVSPKKRKGVDKETNEKRNQKIERKAKQVSKNFKNAKQQFKGRTKRRKR